MKAKEAVAVFRRVAVFNQWASGTCSACKAEAPNHLRSCELADALEATAEKGGACPRCFAGIDEAHAPQCIKAAKA